MKNLKIPQELWIVIYSFDNTYKELFDKVLQELEYKWFIIKYLSMLIELESIFEIFDNQEEEIDWGV